MSWRLSQLSVVRAGYGASTIPFPDNRYAFNYPVKQNYVRRSAPNGFQRAGSMAAGFPAPALLDIPSNRHHPGRGHGAAERHARRDPDRPPRRHAALVERGLPAAAALPAHRRRRLRRQPRRRYRHGRRHQRGHGLRLRQQRPAVLRQVQPHRENRTRTNDNKTTYHGLQIKIDRRFRNGLLLTNSYTLQPLHELRERERRHRHADRLRIELGPLELQSPAQLRRDGVYELPWGPGKRWLNEGVLASIIGGWQVSGIYTRSRARR